MHSIVEYQVNPTAYCIVHLYSLKPINAEQDSTNPANCFIYVHCRTSSRRQRLQVWSSLTQGESPNHHWKQDLHTHIHHTYIECTCESCIVKSQAQGEGKTGQSKCQTGNGGKYNVQYKQNWPLTCLPLEEFSPVQGIHQTYMCMWYTWTQFKGQIHAHVQRHIHTPNWWSQRTLMHALQSVKMKPLYFKQTFITSSTVNAE